MAAPSPPVPRRGDSGASGKITKRRTNWLTPSKIGTGKQASRQRRRAFKLCFFFSSLGFACTPLFDCSAQPSLAGTPIQSDKAGAGA